MSRGRADAGLDFSGETAGRSDEFEPRELPPAETLDPDSTALIGVGAGAPNVEPAGGPAGNDATQASSGQAAWRRRVAPRHRAAVQQFFREK